MDHWYALLQDTWKVPEVSRAFSSIYVILWLLLGSIIFRNIIVAMMGKHRRGETGWEEMLGLVDYRENLMLTGKRGACSGYFIWFRPAQALSPGLVTTISQLLMPFGAVTNFQNIRNELNEEMTHLEVQHKADIFKRQIIQRSALPFPNPAFVLKGFLISSRFCSLALTPFSPL